MHESWMVVITRRQLNEGAVLPVSEEVVEHVVDLKRKAIADKNAREQAAFDIEYEIQKQALKGVNN